MQRWHVIHSFLILVHLRCFNSSSLVVGNDATSTNFSFTVQFPSILIKKQLPIFWFFTSPKFCLSHHSCVAVRCKNCKRSFEGPKRYGSPAHPENWVPGSLRWGEVCWIFFFWKLVLGCFGRYCSWFFVFGTVPALGNLGRFQSPSAEGDRWRTAKTSKNLAL